MAEREGAGPDRTGEKFIGYFRLVDQCGQPGCPVCRCLRDESRRYLDALLYEQVTDPETRRRLRASWGFCNWHAWMLLEIQNSYSGAATIYEDVMGTVVQRVRRSLGTKPSGTGFGRVWWVWRRPKLVGFSRRRQPCPACGSAAEAEHRYLETLVKFVDDADLALAYARSDGLCVPHALRALELLPERPDRRRRLERTMAKWERLRGDLGSFVRKHDYRNTEPYTEDEIASYTRVFETLTGARGLFGNDMHDDRGTPPASRRRPRPSSAGRPTTASGGSRRTTSPATCSPRSSLPQPSPPTRPPRTCSPGGRADRSQA